MPASAQGCGGFFCLHWFLCDFLRGFKMWLLKQKIIFQGAAPSFCSRPSLCYLCRMSVVVHLCRASSAPALPHRPAGASFWKEGDISAHCSATDAGIPAFNNTPTEHSLSKLPCLAEEQLGSRRAVFPGKSPVCVRQQRCSGASQHFQYENWFRQH